MPHNPGKAYLIGAGPGDPGLLTLRGRRLLGVADVVLYDYLANPRILQYARADAELVCLGRHGAGRMLSQGEIAKRMIAEARAGRIVARLKGGDPAIFGRTAEETAALEAAGIAYEIVPGVTSALAASSYAGIPLTHRAAASCVALVTGQECVGKAEGLDMEGLARFPGTLVFYMGVTSAPEWSAALVSHGKAADTPVAIVRHATLPGQQTVRTTLGELGGLVARTNLRPPALIFVGPAVAQGPVQNWFANRPLSGTTVMVTRPAHQADGLAETLESLGAGVVVQPAIEIGPPADWSAVDAAIAEMDRVQWIVFSSANGVRAFLDRIVAVGRDLRALGHVGIAAIGPATGAALQEYHLRCDVQPEEYRAEALAEALIPRAAGGRVLLVRASRGRETLAEALTRSGAEVVQAVAYERRDVRAPRAEAAAALAAGKIDWVTVTSSAIARSLAAMFGDALHRTKLAAISPLTAGVLQQAGYHV
ncbi:MAG TPA: uroporphyrinogen-III C-methyltransferase, partial [Lacipirellulaceae bacterium]|nr:uroporphyrinogen-III C-methyltransferase [Lacipirellulaceae bacterium]